MIFPRGEDIMKNAVCTLMALFVSGFGLISFQPAAATNYNAAIIEPFLFEDVLFISPQEPGKYAWNSIRGYNRGNRDFP